MKARNKLLLLWTVACAGCGRFAPRPEAKPPAPQRPPAAAAQPWTPERITANPGGYLAYADAEIVRQITERETRIGKIDVSRKTVGERSERLRQDIRDAANIQKRLQSAIARADEDQTWPIMFAGQKFERAKAVSIAAASERFAQSRRPLSQDYDQALAKIDATEQSLRSDIAELGRLREKLALDMERVRLNQGIAEVAALRESEAALSGFATSLADTTDNPLEELASKARPLAAEAELETLLKR